MGSPLTRLLLCTMQWNYGNPQLGESYETVHVEPTLRRLPMEVRHFDFVAEIADHGFYTAADNLRRIVDEWRPDVLLCAMYEEQLSRDVIAQITAETPTTTIAWFADDNWRFDTHSRHWSTAFNWVFTTDEASVARHHAIGQANVLLFQWAANSDYFKPTGRPPRYDVTFVGQPHGDRRANIEYLRKHGIDVRTWGPGWPDGPLSGEDMVAVFAESRINLNFSAVSKRRLMGLGAPLKSQMKGRVFEVPACGGLLLTDYTENLEDYYVPGEEIAVFDGRRDLLNRVRHLLANEDERAAIARAGYKRTVAEHTYRKRFEWAFEQMGFELRGGDGA